MDASRLQSVIPSATSTHSSRQDMNLVAEKLEVSNSENSDASVLHPILPTKVHRASTSIYMCVDFETDGDRASNLLLKSATSSQNHDNREPPATKPSTPFNTKASQSPMSSYFLNFPPMSPILHGYLKEIEDVDLLEAEDKLQTHQFPVMEIPSSLSTTTIQRPIIDTTHYQSHEGSEVPLVTHSEPRPENAGNTTWQLNTWLSARDHDGVTTAEWLLQHSLLYTRESKV
jgi:hypothetical protein